MYQQRVYRGGRDPETEHPLVDALVTVCVVDRETFKPVNLKKTFAELYAKYDEVAE